MVLIGEKMELNVGANQDLKIRVVFECRHRICCQRKRNHQNI